MQRVQGWKSIATPLSWLVFDGKTFDTLKQGKSSIRSIERPLGTEGALSLGMNVAIATANGSVNVKATVHGTFAAHKTIGAKGWSVSHVPSGLGLLHGMFGAKHAATVAEMLSKIEGFSDLIAALVASPNDRTIKIAIQKHTRGLVDRAWDIASRVEI